MANLYIIDVSIHNFKKFSLILPKDLPKIFSLNLWFALPPKKCDQTEGCLQGGMQVSTLDMPATN